MVLCANTAEERELWIAALEYAIISTKRVKSIMRQNEQTLLKKSQKAAKRINSRGSIDLQRSNSKIEKTSYEQTKKLHKRSKFDRIFNNSIMIEEPS